MADGRKSKSKKVNVNPRETLNIFQWKIENARKSIENAKEGEEMMSAVFVGKSDGLPNSAWRIKVVLNDRKKADDNEGAQVYGNHNCLGVYLEFIRELNTHNPVVKARYEFYLVSGNKLDLSCSNTKSKVREFGPEKSCFGCIMETHIGMLRATKAIIQKHFFDNEGALRVKVELWIQNDNELNKTLPKMQHLYQLHNDFSQMLDSSAFSDVSIVTPDLTLKAHKIILSGRSQVFSAMFQHDLSESQTNTVKIDEFSGQTVKRMLEFIYSGSVEGVKDDYLKLLKIADKYQLEELKAVCLNEVLLKLSAENVTEVLILGEMYNVPKLKSSAMDFINSNKSKSMFSQDNKSGTVFKKFAEEHPKLLLEIYEDLRNHSERVEQSQDPDQNDTVEEVEEMVMVTTSKRLRMN